MSFSSRQREISSASIVDPEDDFDDASGHGGDDFQATLAASHQRAEAKSTQVWQASHQ